MASDAVQYALPQVMRVEECQKLDEFIRAHAGIPIDLDGREIEKIGGLAAQLIAAHQKCRDETAKLRILHSSDACVEALRILGLSKIINSDEAAA